MHRRAPYAFVSVKNGACTKELADKIIHKFWIVQKEIAVPDECLKVAICGQMAVIFKVINLRYQHHNLEVRRIGFNLLTVFVGD
jgi:hypothetical protein